MMGRFCRYAEKVFQLGQMIPQVRDDRQEPQIPTGAIWTSTFAMLAMRAGSLHAMESQLRVPKRLDGLYLEAPFVNFCVAHGKHVLTTLKGDHRVLMQDAQALVNVVEPKVWERADRTVRLWDIEDFRCCEGIDVPLRVVHAEEIVRVRQRIARQWVERAEPHTWWWATTAPQRLLPTRVSWQAGHARWDVENDAFNVLSTHWYLDHCFKHHPVAIENFVLTLFIAFVLLQHFYLRNCKPSVRSCFTFIAIAQELHAGLVAEAVLVPWPIPPAGTPP